MQLTEYLQTAGFRKIPADQIARAYAEHDPSEFDIWLLDMTENSAAKTAIKVLCEEWRKQYGGGRANRVVATIVEPVAARPYCLYRVVAPDEAYGRCYAAMRVPLHFPGAMDSSGGPPAEWAVVAAEQDPETQLFKWLSLTPNMKSTFGWCLEQGGIEPGRWAIIREFDLLRNENPGQAAAAGLPPETPPSEPAPQ